MNFKLDDAKESDKQTIFNLFQLYIYELSFYEDDVVKFNIEDNGLYKISKYVPLYWKEENRHPYILKCDNKLAGFVFIRFNEENMYEVGEFFVLNKYRKMGAGKYMAFEMFNKYKGNWEIRTLIKNERAQSFWRNVISSYTNSNFEEKYIRDNTKYAFYFKS